MQVRNWLCDSGWTKWKAKAGPLQRSHYVCDENIPDPWGKQSFSPALAFQNTVGFVEGNTEMWKVMALLTNAVRRKQ